MLQIFFFLNNICIFVGKIMVWCIDIPLFSFTVMIGKTQRTFRYFAACFLLVVLTAWVAEHAQHVRTHYSELHDHATPHHACALCTATFVFYHPAGEVQCPPAVYSLQRRGLVSVCRAELRRSYEVLCLRGPPYVKHLFV